MLKNPQFYVVIASHGHENIVVPYLDAALKELARIGKWEIIHLPMAGRHSQIHIVRDIEQQINDKVRIKTQDWMDRTWLKSQLEGAICTVPCQCGYNLRPLLLRHVAFWHPRAV